MYQALYRKYRPKTFDDLLGQDHVTKTLKNQILNDSIGHAYLFSGTRGTGKTSAAKIFSRAVNCLDTEDGNPCNKCRNCLEILDDSTMDVIEMDAASNNSVEDIRQLREKVIYPPATIKKKVYIIDEVHMLSKGAFNALLKTLEEPPKHLIFILATTEPERLPQTILSRCQRFDFKRLTNKDIIDNMKKITEDIGADVDDEVLKLIARNSDGAMRDALSLLDQCVSFDNKKITYEDAINILGITNVDLIFNLVEDIKNQSLEKALVLIDDIIGQGKDIEQFIKDLIVHFRNLMIIKSSKNAKDILQIDNIDKYTSQSNDFNLEYIMNILEILTKSESDVKWSSQPRIVLEMAMINIIKSFENLSLSDRVKRLEEGYVEIPRKELKIDKIKEKKVENKDVVNKEIPVKSTKKVEKPSPKVKIDGDLSLETIKENWKNILNSIRVEKVSIYALIVEGSVIDFNNNMLTINYDEGYGFHKEAISKDDNKSLVEQIISNYFGKEIIVDFTIGKKKLVKEDIPKKEDKDIEEDIKKAIDIFGEDIVNIK